MLLPVNSSLPKGNGIVYRPALRGLGQDTYDLPAGMSPTLDTSLVTPPSYTTPDLSSFYSQTLNTPISSGSSGSSASSGVNNSNLTASTLNSLLTGGLKIAQLTAAQQTPAGTALVYNAAGQLVSASTEPAGVALGTSAVTTSIAGIPTSMWIIILAVGAFMLMQSRH
jgi:hypothetical protein